MYRSVFHLWWLITVTTIQNKWGRKCCGRPVNRKCSGPGVDRCGLGIILTGWTQTYRSRRVRCCCTLSRTCSSTEPRGREKSPEGRRPETVAEAAGPTPLGGASSSDANNAIFVALPPTTGVLRRSSYQKSSGPFIAVPEKLITGG